MHQWMKRKSNQYKTQNPSKREETKRADCLNPYRCEFIFQSKPFPFPLGLSWIRIFFFVANTNWRIESGNAFLFSIDRDGDQKPIQTCTLLTFGISQSNTCSMRFKCKMRRIVCACVLEHLSLVYQILFTFSDGKNFLFSDSHLMGLFIRLDTIPFHSNPFQHTKPVLTS